MVDAKIQLARFTGKGDRDPVATLYRSYIDRITGVLQSTLALAVAFDVGHTASELPPIPSVIAPPAAPLHLADGQLLLRLSDTSERHIGLRTVQTVICPRTRIRVVAKKTRF